MKLLAKLVFKIHKLIYGYPTKSEIRLVLEDEVYQGGLTWYVGMLYVCGESIDEICNWMGMTREEVIKKLNETAKKVKL